MLSRRDGRHRAGAIDSGTLINGTGEKMDLGLAVDAMLQAAGS